MQNTKYKKPEPNSFNEFFESSLIALGTGIVILLLCGIGVLGYFTVKGTCEVASDAYHKSPTLQRTVDTPVQIIKELKQ